LEDLLKKIKNCKELDEAKELLQSQIKITKEIEKALEFSIKQHEGQTRKSGEPYSIHPILVSSLVAYMGGDAAMVIAGLLHDVVEDTCCNTDEIKEAFSPEVAVLVDGLTKIMEIREDQLIPSNSNEKLVSSALTFRKILLASIKDVRVLVIKLCDRVHNMLTLDFLSPQKQQRISEETLVVYVPIAHRLGISSLKNILEDLSFYYLLPNEYKKIDSYLQEHKQQLQLKLNHFTNKVHTLMLQNGFAESDFSISKRIKHHYSTYLKMQRNGISIEEVLDLLAIRILVKEPNDCYRALGVIHQNFNLLISRFKDYIALAKENGYQTIHTTVFDDKSIIEAQIRTYDMHRTAEYGVAAHWKYKSGELLNPRLDWLSDLTSQDDDDGQNIEEFYEFAKDSLYSEDIVVFSPKGDIFTMPRGATALDFAYEVHTEVGTHTKEAYINRQKVPLLTELKNGDIVRIITSKEPHFRCSWINSVKTGKARNTIKQNCKQKTKEINQRVAISILAAIFGTRKGRVIQWLRRENLHRKIFKAAFDSVYLQDVVNALKKYARRDKLLFPLLKIDRYKVRKQKFDNIVIYSNQKVDIVEFDYCCHPKRGDDIIGFRKGNEVTVHHKMCERAAKMMEENEELIFVKWTRIAPHRYTLIVSLENRRGSLALFLSYLAKMQVNLITIELGKSEEGHADFFEMSVEIPEGVDASKVQEKIREKYKLIDFISLKDAYKD